MRRNLRAPSALILVCLGCIGTFACTSERDRACAELLKSKLEGDSTAEVGASRRTYFSETLETCLLVEESRIRVNTRIRDLSGDFLQRMPLFYCDRDGVDAGIIDSIRVRRGNVWTVPFHQWSDDGAGGPPRALKSPPKPFTGEDCAAALRKYLAQVE